MYCFVFFEELSFTACYTTPPVIGIYLSVASENRAKRSLSPRGGRNGISPSTKRRSCPCHDQQELFYKMHILHTTHVSPASKLRRAKYNSSPDCSSLPAPAENSNPPLVGVFVSTALPGPVALPRPVPAWLLAELASLIETFDPTHVAQSTSSAVPTARLRPVEPKMASLPPSSEQRFTSMTPPNSFMESVLRSSCAHKGFPSADTSQSSMYG